MTNQNSKLPPDFQTLNAQTWCYCNRTKQVQIIRSYNSNCYLERAIFPDQQFQFDALPETQLEIHVSSEVSMILSDRIFCKQLQVPSSNISI